MSERLHNGERRAALHQGDALKMKLRPNPSTRPRTTGRLVIAATHETAP